MLIKFLYKLADTKKGSELNFILSVKLLFIYEDRLNELFNIA